MDTERRVKVVRVPAGLVLEWAYWVFGQSLPRYVYVPRPFGLDLPNDVRVLSVREDFCSRSFDFLVSHPSFDEVLAGLEPPLVQRPIDTRYEAVELKRPEDADDPAVVTA